MRSRMLLAAAFLVVLSQAPASGRVVTEEERAKLATALAVEGCSGGVMVFDHGKYEVEETVCRDGNEYDLVFDASFKLIKELDD